MSSMNNISNTQFIGLDMLPLRPPAVIIFKFLKAFSLAQRKYREEVSVDIFLFYSSRPWNTEIFIYSLS